MRRTKIIATLGPATQSIHSLEDIILAGANLVRINFSHGDKNTHLQQVVNIRKLAKKHKKQIGVLMDLQGPKIRIGKFKNKESIVLEEKDSFIISCDLANTEGNQQKIGVSFESLYRDVKKNDMLALDDGKILVKVEKIVKKDIYTKVLQGGLLGQNKGINLKSGGLSAPSITAKDKKDIQTAIEAEADYLAISFVRSAEDILMVKKILKKQNFEIGIIAKIERSEALEEERIKEIIQHSDAIMVARGDLGVEIGDAFLPAQQKKLIVLAKSQDTAVIIATQMMESMILEPIPTRAEVFDVANAVMDETDAVMLSAETAIGKYPAKVVATMSNICWKAEHSPTMQKLKENIETQFFSTEESIALSAMYVANRLKVKAIASITQSGNTPKIISRTTSAIPIFAFSQYKRTLAKMALYRGVFPCSLQKTKNLKNIEADILAILKKENKIACGDKVILTVGTQKIGTTNTLKILKTP